MYSGCQFWILGQVPIRGMLDLEDLPVYLHLAIQITVCLLARLPNGALRGLFAFRKDESRVDNRFVDHSRKNENGAELVVRGKRDN